MNAETPRRLGTGTLVIASHNAGKVAEIGDLLRPFGVDVVSVGALQLPVPDETETTFIGNATIKARAAAAATGLPALADNSGLCVHALGGEPGVYSADWGGPSGISPSPCDGWRSACRDLPTGAPTSSAPSSFAGQTVTALASRASSTANWSGRHAAAAALATIRCSYPTVTPRASAK